MAAILTNEAALPDTPSWLGDIIIEEQRGSFTRPELDTSLRAIGQEAVRGATQEMIGQVAGRFLDVTKFLRYLIY